MCVHVCGGAVPYCRRVSLFVPDQFDVCSRGLPSFCAVTAKPMPLFASPDNYISDTLPIFLVQVFIVLVTTRVLGRLLKLVHQPAVIGTLPFALFCWRAALSTAVGPRLLHDCLTEAYILLCAGEIIGGIILGPTVLGHAKGWSHAIFPPATLPQFVLVANLGLIFFM